MIKIAIVTHGTFAEGIVSSLVVIVGNDCGVTPICISVEDAPETIYGKIELFLNTCGSDNVKLILTDIPGGSTTTNAIRFANSAKKTYVVTGLNLGMLLEFVLHQEDENIEEHIRTVIEHSKSSILFINDMLPKV